MGLEHRSVLIVPVLCVPRQARIRKQRCHGKYYCKAFKNYLCLWQLCSSVKILYRLLGRWEDLQEWLSWFYGFLELVNSLEHLKGTSCCDVYIRYVWVCWCTACIASCPLHSVRKPSKRLSLLELSEPCVKAQIDDRVWQRLVYGRSSRAEPRVSENECNTNRCNIH